MTVLSVNRFALSCIAIAVLGGCSSFDPLFTGDRVDAPVPVVRLADGSDVCGFICEQAGVAGAEDITAFGSWRRWLAAGKD